MGVVVSPDEIEEAVSRPTCVQTEQKTRRHRNSYYLSFKPNTIGYTTVVPSFIQLKGLWFCKCVGTGRPSAEAFLNFDHC